MDRKLHEYRKTTTSDLLGLLQNLFTTRNWKLYSNRRPRQVKSPGNQTRKKNEMYAVGRKCPLVPHSTTGTEESPSPKQKDTEMNGVKLERVLCIKDFDVSIARSLKVSQQCVDAIDQPDMETAGLYK